LNSNPIRLIPKNERNNPTHAKLRVNGETSELLKLQTNSNKSKWPKLFTNKISSRCKESKINTLNSNRPSPNIKDIDSDHTKLFTGVAGSSCTKSKTKKERSNQTAPAGGSKKSNCRKDCDKADASKWLTSEIGGRTSRRRGADVDVAASNLRRGERRTSWLPCGPAKTLQKDISSSFNSCIYGPKSGNLCLGSPVPTSILRHEKLQWIKVETKPLRTGLETSLVSCRIFRCISPPNPISIISITCSIQPKKESPTPTISPTGFFPPEKSSQNHQGLHLHMAQHQQTRLHPGCAPQEQRQLRAHHIQRRQRGTQATAAQRGSRAQPCWAVQRWWGSISSEVQDEKGRVLGELEGPMVPEIFWEL